MELLPHNFYTMEPTYEAAQWSVGMRVEEASRTKFYEKFGREVRQLWNIEGTINVNLWYKYFDNPKYQNLGYCDLHKWVGDVMHEPPMKGGPTAFYLIMSERVADIFEMYAKTKHRFHEMQITKEDTNEQRKYFLYQTVNTIYQLLDYDLTQFYVTDVRQTEVYGDVEQGKISNEADYKAYVEFLRETDRYKNVMPKQLIFKEFYHVFQSIDGRIVIHEELKSHLESLELKGVRFIPYKKCEVFFNLDS